MNTSARPRARISVKDRLCRVLPPISATCSPTDLCSSASTPRPRPGSRRSSCNFPMTCRPSAVKAAIEAQQAHHARHQHAAGRARRRVRPCRGARPREGLAGAVCAARSTTSSAIGGSAIHCLAGMVAAGATPGGRTRLHRQSEARRRSRRRQKHHAADRADQSAATGRIIFSTTSSTPPTSSRKIGKPNIKHAVRFLSRADRRRRSDPPAGEISCRWSAICNARRCRRGTSRTRARSTIPRCSRRSTGSATAAGSAPNIARAARTEDGLGWAAQYGVVPPLTPINHQTS